MPRRIEAPRAAGVAGIVFAVLLIASLVLLRRQPPVGASTAEIEHFYLGGHAKTLGVIGFYAAPFAGIAFLWFIAVIRAHIGELEDRFFATLFLGSGLLFVAMLFAAAACAGSLVAGVKFQGAPIPGPATVDLARSLGYTFLYVFAIRAAAVFMIVTSTIAWRTRTLPRWLVVVGWIVSLVMLFTISFYKWIALLFPVWVVVVSIVILVTARLPAEDEETA